MPKTDIPTLLAEWRRIGPVAWAESQWVTEEGSRIVLEPWQRATLEAWHALREEITTLSISNVKKTGKTSLNAILTAWRWLCLGGEHVCAANDLDQAASRVFGFVADACRHNSFLANNVAIDAKRLTFRPTGATLTALSTEPKGSAGSNHWTASHTEAWGITLQASVRNFEELTPPPGRRHGLPALRICDSYAGWTEESKTWHDLVDRGLEGEAVSEDWPIYRSGGLLLFHMDGAEAQERCFRGSAVDREAYYGEQKRTLRGNSYARLHLNQRAEGEESLISAEEWDAITDPRLTPLVHCKDIPVWVGLDLSQKSDTTGLVAMAADGIGKARLAFHRIWEPSKGKPVSLAAVAAELLELHAYYWIVGVGYDPYQGALLAELLKGKGLRMNEVVQSAPSMGPRGLRLWSAIRDRSLRVYPDETLRRHALNAIGKDVPQGLMLKKVAGSRKIDLMAAAAMCCLEAMGGQGRPAADGVMERGLLEMQEASRWTSGGEAGEGLDGMKSCHVCHVFPCVCGAKAYGGREGQSAEWGVSGTPAFSRSRFRTGF